MIVINKIFLKIQADPITINRLRAIPEMKCSYCNSRAVHYAQHFGKYLCKPHLERYLLRKLHRNLRKYKLVSPEDVVAFDSDESPVSAAAKLLFQKAVSKWPVKIVDIKEPHNKLLVPHTLECETTAVIDNLAAGKIHYSAYAEGNTIKPFRDFTSQELFILGWLTGCKNQGSKKGHALGTASQLNLLRTWDQVTEILRHQRNGANKEEMLKPKQVQKSRP